MSQTFIKIVTRLPIELQQEILSQTLKDTDINYQTNEQSQYGYSRRKSPQRSHYASLWWNFPEIIKFVSSHPKMIIDVLLDNTIVTLILNSNVRIRFMVNPNYSVHAVWIKRISCFKLERLNVRVRSLGNTFGETHKIEIVKMINRLIAEFNPPEFGFNEFTTDFSYLLNYKYKWIDKITILEDFPASDIDNIYTQIERFKSLKTIKFKVSWTFFGPVNINAKLEKFENLLKVVDKMIFSLGLYDRRVIDYEVEDSFITFFNQHTDKIEFQMDDIACPFDYRGRRMLNCAHRINHFTATSSGNFDYTGDQDTIATAKQLDKFKLLSRFDMITSMTIDIPCLQDLYLTSPHIQDLTIICETCENVNLSKLTNLVSLSITALEHLDTPTVNSIPVNTTRLSISCNSYDFAKFKIQRYLQHFTTTPDLLSQFDFRLNEHLSNISLHIHRFDNLDTDDKCWTYIPSTVDFVSLSYTLGQHDSDPDATVATTDTIISPSAEEEKKMFGITIPQSITQLSLSLFFKDNNSLPTRITGLGLGNANNDDANTEQTDPIGSGYYRVDAIYINSDKQGSSIYDFLTGSNKVNRWANIEISENTKLDLILTLGNINPDILIVCDDEIVHNVDCYLCDSSFAGYADKKRKKGGYDFGQGRVFEKYDGNEGVSYLSCCWDENSGKGFFRSCSIV